MNPHDTEIFKIKTSPPAVAGYRMGDEENGGWSKEQATHLAGAIKADTPEQLWEVAPLWLEHCGDSMKYVNDMLGSVAMGLIEVTQGEDGEWMFKLNDKGMGVGKQLNEEKS